MATGKLDEAAIFNEARQIEEPEARGLFIQQACSGDQDLLARIEALLRAHDEQQNFLDVPTRNFRELLGSPGGEGPGTQIGSYKLLQQLGQGGMGTVFLAEQLQPVQRKVAFKIIRPGLESRQVIARFEAERQALALMDHPNIAKVFDAGTVGQAFEPDTASPSQTGDSDQPDGRPYFVMELVQGVPITRYCDTHRLTPRQRLELFVPVCQAVQHAHQKGIIHRDLKPSNVLVAEYADEPVPKIIDFGIVKALGPKLTERTLFTEFGSVVGTLEYMSPEQAEPGQIDIDTRSDIYSLGAMLYELLTGTTPLDRKQLEKTPLLELLRIVREEEPPRPSTRLGTTEEQTVIAAKRNVEPKYLSGLLRGDLDWIVMKCLEKDRTRRYATANALARDIEHYLNEEPVEACPPSAGYRLRKFARRHRKLLLGATAFVLLLTTATAVSAWLAVRATLAERVADRERRVADQERKQALAEKERADEQAAIAEAVNKFLNGDLLIQASTEQSADRDLKLRTVLDRASEKVDGRFPSQPLVAARIHKTLGSAYSSLGELDLAERHARRSYELYLKKLGPDAPLTVGAMHNLGTSLFYQGRLADAEQCYADALERERRVFDPEDPVKLVTMSNLAGVYGITNRLDDSRKLLEEALEIQRRVVGEGGRDTLTTMHNLAGTYLNMKRVDEARRMYEKALDVERLHLGPRDPFTLKTTLGMADLLAFEGRHDKANALRQGVLELGRQSLPPEHPILMQARDLFASSLWELGSYGDSIKRYEEMLEILRRALKPGHPRTMNTLNTLAWHLATAPDPKDRDPLRAVGLAKEVVEHSPKRSTAWNTLGVASYRARDWKAAITALEKAEELTPGKSLGYNAVFLAMAHWQLGEKEKARQWYDRALTWIQKNGPSDPELVRFRVEAAQVLGLAKGSQ